MVSEWVDDSYEILWIHTETGYSLSRVSISSDASTIVAGWYLPPYPFESVRITVHSPLSPSPLWTFDYEPVSGPYQEYISDIELTEDGGYIIAGSFGDYYHTNPEVHIFDRIAGPPPLFSVDMPGSIFSVDISGKGRFASACGKHVHANESGHGGDIVAIDLTVQEGAPLEVFLEDYPSRIVRGTTGTFTAGVRNIGDEEGRFDFAVMSISGPASRSVTLYDGVPVTLKPGKGRSTTVSQYVPGNTPTGIYTVSTAIYVDDLRLSRKFFDVEVTATLE
jgi:hypothetical protein